MGIDTHATWRALHGQVLQQNRHNSEVAIEATKAAKRGEAEVLDAAC
jgi:hypothetical protein